MKKALFLVTSLFMGALLFFTLRSTPDLEAEEVDLARVPEKTTLELSAEPAGEPAHWVAHSPAILQKISQGESTQGASMQPSERPADLLDIETKSSEELLSVSPRGGTLDAKHGPQETGALSGKAPGSSASPEVPVEGTRSNPMAVPGRTPGSATTANGLDPNKPYFLPPGQNPVQSPARPMDLEVIGEVQAAVDDPGYTHFIMDTLKELTPRLETHFEKRDEIVESSLEAEFEDLILEEDAYVRVYFVKEGTVFHNSLGIGLENEDKLIFPDTSSVVSYFRDGDTRRDAASAEVPLLPGDYVDLGLMEAGSLLDFFLIQDGARNEEGNIYGLDKEANPDQANHIRIHDVVDDNTLIIGFEDLPGGGDQDYNDLVIAVEKIPLEQN